MADSSPAISRLAEDVFSNVKVLDAYLKANNLPGPTFHADGPVSLGIGPDSEHVEEARAKALNAAAELCDLLQGPLYYLRPIVRAGRSCSCPRVSPSLTLVPALHPPSSCCYPPQMFHRRIFLLARQCPVNDEKNSTLVLACKPFRDGTLPPRCP
jgi:hypothetical protein